MGLLRLVELQRMYPTFWCDWEMVVQLVVAGVVVVVPAIVVDLQVLEVVSVVVVLETVRLLFDPLPW